VQDNFLNNRLEAASLCLNLAALRNKPTWNCYATIPDIDEETPEFLAKGGCISTYIGIDAVTVAQKRQFGKYFAKSQDQCVEKIQALLANSIVPTCSFILDPFNWSDDELEESLRWAVRLRLEGAELSFHVLTAYGNTSLFGKQQDTHDLIPDDFRIRIMFDCPEVVIQNHYAKTLPGLFPFHCRSTGNHESYQSAVVLIHLAQALISIYPYEFTDLIKSDKMRVTDILRSIYKQIHPSLWKSPEPRKIKLVAQSIFEEKLCKSHGFVPAI
jgi:radical SAM superfamily enzyme YgiQ (UPF0313 family)